MTVKDRCRGFMDVRELVSLASVHAKLRSNTLCTTLLAVYHTQVKMVFESELACLVFIMHHHSKRIPYICSRILFFCTFLRILQH